jgi:hypothetical protein
MVKTLKITTITVAVFALALIIFIAAKGIASDKDIEKFLKAPGIAAQMQESSTGTKVVATDQETPLLKQSKAFALRINPPPPPAPPPADVQSSSEPVRPKVDVSAKFTLVGTSYYTGDEANSWALINEVGKGWHWVRQGEKIGHLTVEKIADGIVLIRDGKQTYDLTAERKQKPDYVKSYTGPADSNKTTAPWQTVETPAALQESKEQNPVPNTENAQDAPPPEPEINKKDIQENIDWLKQIQENPESIGMTAEEAKELEGLGNLLNSLETEIKTIESNEPNTLNEPNTANGLGSTTIEDPNKQKSPEMTQQNQKEEPAFRPSRVRRRK